MRKSRTVAIVALVFIAEVLALGSYVLWVREQSSSEWLTVAAMFAAIVVWGQLARPIGRFSGLVFTPVVRAVLFTLAVIAVWDAGHHTLGMVQACVFIAAAELSRVPEVQETIGRAHAARVMRSRSTVPVPSR